MAPPKLNNMSVTSVPDPGLTPGSTPPPNTTTTKAPSSDPQANNITIHTALPSDAAAIAALGRKTFDVSFGWSMPRSDLEAYLDEAYTPEAIAKEIADPNTVLLVAKEGPDGKAVAFGQMVRGVTDPCLKEAGEGVADGNVDAIKGHTYFQRLYADPATQGKGVGSRIIKMLEEQARADGQSKLMWLTAWKENPAAVRLYERFGFEKKGRYGFVMGTCTQYDHIMVKHL